MNFICFPDDSLFRSIHFRDDKTGELYSDKMELQILELKKLPPNVKSGEDIVAWMRFFSGRTRAEFMNMAKTNEYYNEAYNTLLHLSADEAKIKQYGL